MDGVDQDIQVSDGLEPCCLHSFVLKCVSSTTLLERA